MNQTSRWKLGSAVLGTALVATLLAGTFSNATALPERSGSIEAVTAPGPGSFQPLTPKRVFTTATGGGKIQAGKPRTFTIAGIPANATAVTATITASKGSQAATLTAFPGGEAKPPTSTMNYPAILSHATTTTVKLGANRLLSLAITAGTVDVAVDLQGFYLPPITGIGGYLAWAKVRGDGTVDAFHNPTGAVAVVRAQQGLYQVRFFGLPQNKKVNLQVSATEELERSFCEAATSSGPDRFLIQCSRIAATPVSVDTTFTVQVMF